MFKTRYNHDVSAGIVFTEPSKTDQSQAASTDINNILRRFDQTGQLISENMVPFETLQYGDESIYPDYETALALVNDVERDFYSLPASIRDEFGNDARRLTQAVSDKKQYGKLEKLGIFKRMQIPAQMDKINAAASTGTEKQVETSNPTKQDETKKQNNDK